MCFKYSCVGSFVLQHNGMKVMGHSKGHYIIEASHLDGINVTPKGHKWFPLECVITEWSAQTCSLQSVFSLTHLSPVSFMWCRLLCCVITRAFYSSYAIGAFQPVKFCIKNHPHKIRQRQLPSPLSPKDFSLRYLPQKYCCYSVIIYMSLQSCCLWPASLSVRTFPATASLFGCYATSPGRHFYCACAFLQIDDLFNVFLLSHNLNLMLLMFSAVALNLEADKPLQDTALIFYFLSDGFSRDPSFGHFPWFASFPVQFLSWFSLSTSQDFLNLYTIIVG